MKAHRPAPLNALRAFEAAARHLSFQAAAAQLFVTPAAVSQQVKRLEAHLGIALFLRGHRAVELTAEGQALAASLAELFAQLELALARATAPHSADLRISTIESFAAKWLAPRLHRFHRDHPGLKLRIETGDGHSDLPRSGVDVAIRYGAGAYPGMRTEHLLDAPVFPVCAPSLATALSTADDLHRHTLLHDQSSAGRAGVPDWATWLQAADVDHADAARGPVFASIYLAQEAAASGHGVALGIGPLVQDDLQRSRLVQPFGLTLPNAYAFWVVRAPDARAHAGADAFCAWLRSEADAERPGL